MKLQEYLRLKSDPGVLNYISVYAKYSGEHLRTIGPLVLHIHIENLKQFLVKNQLSAHQSSNETMDLLFVNIIFHSVIFRFYFFLFYFLMLLANVPIFPHGFSLFPTETVLRNHKLACYSNSAQLSSVI